MSCAYSGNLLATNSSMPHLNVGWENHTMTIWDVATGKPRHTVKEGSLCAFTRDGRWAAIAAPIKPRMTEYRITLWDAATGAEKTLPDSFYALSTISLDFSPDGKRLVVCGFGLTIPPEGIDAATNFWQVRLYDVAAGTGTLLTKQDRARVAFSGDSKLLAIYGGKVSIWDVATAKELATVPEEMGSLHAALAADGKSLMTLNRGWWKRDGLGATGKIMPFNSSTGGAGALEKPADIAPVYEVHVWDVPSPLTPRPKGEGNALTCRHRFVASWGGKIENRFDDISVNALWFGVRSAFRLSPNGRNLLTLVRASDFAATGAAGDRLQVWDVATGKQEGDLGDGGTEFANIAYTTDGRLLAATTQRLNLHLSYERPITPEFRSTVHFGPGEYNAQFRVRLWDLTNQKELAVPDYEGCALPAQVGATNDLGRTVDYVVLLLTSPEFLSRGSNTEFVSANHDAVYAVVPRDRAWSKEVHLVERETKKVLHVLKGHEAISRVAFSPDGKTLAVGDYGGMIRLWNVAAGRLLMTIPAHPGGTPGVAMSPVTGLAFRGDGRVLASCSAGEIRLWYAATTE
jgi:WD40 repeat protein